MKAVQLPIAATELQDTVAINWEAVTYLILGADAGKLRISDNFPKLVLWQWLVLQNNGTNST